MNAPIRAASFTPGWPATSTPLATSTPHGCDDAEGIGDILRPEPAREHDALLGGERGGDGQSPV